MKLLIILTVAALAAASYLFYGYEKDSIKPQPVASLDLARYAGLWYEIARTAFYEKDSYCTTANYTLNSNNNTITVVNTCNVDSPDGRVKVVKGVATPVDPVNGTETVGDLHVKFGFLRGGAYYVLALDPNYQWSLVGSSTTGQVWILSRTPTLDQNIYSQLLNQATQDGYDLSNLIQTYQGPDCSWSNDE